MIRLYLIRHGETEWNKAKRFQGWTDIELSEEGIRQAELLGERFKKIDIDEIYSSPLKRAVSTAKAVAKATNLDIKTNENFKEINFGEWEGLTAKEISAKFGNDFDEFIRYPENGTFPGDISFDHVTERIKKALTRFWRARKIKILLLFPTVES